MDWKNERVRSHPRKPKSKTYVMRNEARKRSNFGKHSNFVQLCHDSVQNFSLEWPKHDRLVLHRIDHKALTRLNNPGTYVVDCGDRNYEAVLSGARSFHFGVQLLLHCVEQRGAEVTRSQEDFMFQ